jgi:FMN phosphatase YigB (HAD superfamily)
MKPITIVWDVDDVLNEFTRLWFEKALKSQHKFNLLFEDIRENPPTKILRMKEQEYFRSIDRFRVSEEARNMSPNPYVLGWFKQHGHKFEHIALSSRPLSTIPALSEWIFRFYGSWIRTFGYVPSRKDVLGSTNIKKNKHGYLKWLGKGDIFIDDNTDNVLTVESLGIETILFPQPWNNSTLGVGKVLNLLLKYNLK